MFAGLGVNHLIHLHLIHIFRGIRHLNHLYTVKFLSAIEQTLQHVLK